MPRDTFYFFVNGIRTDPEDVRGWQFRAARWIETTRVGRAGTYAYHTYAVTRWLEQETHVRRCYECLAEYVGNHNIVFVGHSNAGDLFLRLLREYPTLPFRAAHLIAPAADPDFERNGLNRALRRGQVDRVVVYGSEDDRALKLAGFSRRVLGWAGLGYGDLGRVGARNVGPDVEHLYKPDFRPGYDHSDWFDTRGGAFYNVMRKIVLRSDPSFVL